MLGWSSTTSGEGSFVALDPDREIDHRQSVVVAQAFCCHFRIGLTAIGDGLGACDQLVGSLALTGALAQGGGDLGSQQVA
jgi:hypothetical protein